MKKILCIVFLFSAIVANAQICTRTLLSFENTKSDILIAKYQINGWSSDSETEFDDIYDTLPIGCYSVILRNESENYQSIELLVDGETSKITAVNYYVSSDDSLKRVREIKMLGFKPVIDECNSMTQVYLKGNTEIRVAVYDDNFVKISIYKNQINL